MCCEWDCVIFRTGKRNQVWGRLSQLGSLIRTANRFLSLTATFLFCAILAWGQTARPALGEASDREERLRLQNAPVDYAIGAGDVLTIVIADLPERSGKYSVSETGMLELPEMPIRATGLTPAELSRKIGEALKRAKQLRDPVVSVFVEEYRSQTVTVLGAVAHPSVYPLRKSTSLLEVLSMAGGLVPQSGNNLTLQRKNSGAANQAANTNKGLYSNIDLGRLMQGKDPSLNLQVQGGDVVTVSTAPLVYVVGAVVKPGGFVLQDPSAGLTILQALAMAEGLRPTAAPNRAVIIRTKGRPNEYTNERIGGSESEFQSAQLTVEGSGRQEIQVDVMRVLQGKESDVLLEANDVLFVPESGMKRSLRRMSEFAMQVVNGVAVYGIGYRVGGVH